MYVFFFLQLFAMTKGLLAARGGLVETAEGVYQLVLNWDERGSLSS